MCRGRGILYPRRKVCSGENEARVCVCMCVCCCFPLQCSPSLNAHWKDSRRLTQRALMTMARARFRNPTLVHQHADKHVNRKSCRHLCARSHAQTEGITPLEMADNSSQASPGPRSVAFPLIQYVLTATIMPEHGK